MNDRTGTRLAALRRRMTAEGVDLVALAPGANMNWLLGFSPHADERPTLLLVGPERESMVVPELNAADVVPRTKIDLSIWNDADGAEGATKQALAAVCPASPSMVAVDETMRTDFVLPLLDLLKGTRHQMANNTVGHIRMRKDPTECGSLRENAAIADSAVQAIFAALKPGISEVELAEIGRKEFRRQKAEPTFAIVASGPNGALPHHATGNRKLQAGDAVVIDIGGSKDGMCSDITRMAVIGTPPEGYEEVHAIVERAAAAAIEMACPGVRAKDVDAAARQVITDAGYGEYFVHRTGHGLGTETHEPPYIVSSSEFELDEGMVFSIEPGIYLPGKFGIRLEEIVIMNATGVEVLSGLARDWHVAGAN